MISVAEALEQIFALLAPLPTETVPLSGAAGLVLAEEIRAARDQPPFAASAMDGYALGPAAAGATLEVIGEAAAGVRFAGSLRPGQAVRIFTGAPLPAGADRVVPQEDAQPLDGAVRLGEAPVSGAFVRPAGGDFVAGHNLSAPRRLGARDIALLAAMGAGAVPVHRRAEVAILTTGDELVPPGAPAAPDQIYASNGYGLAALVEAAGARPRLLPPVPDRAEALADALGLAADADLIVTTGGASAGDHDLFARMPGTLGLTPAFHKVAMRPGKPLLAGRVGATPLIGLPGNPVSAMVCGLVFVLPALAALSGLPPGPARRTPARLAAPVAENGAREHYMRATRDADGAVSPAPRQDSALLSVLAGADCLLVRPPQAPALPAGAAVEILDLP